MTDQDEAIRRYQAEAHHRLERELQALAIQLAHEWGWPDADSVFTRLRGDRTTALATFTEEAYAAYLGVTLTSGPGEDES